MLKKMYNFSKKEWKAIYEASAWRAIFELIALLPLGMIGFVFKRMMEAQASAVKMPFNYLIYFGLATLLVLILYFIYRKMYYVKYISAGSENLNQRMSLADKLRRLPESFLSRRDLSDLTSTIMDDQGIIEGVLANQLTEMIGGFIAIALAFIIMFFVNVKMALVLLIVVPPTILVMSLCDLISGGTHKRNRMRKLAISDQIQEYLENIKVLKASGRIGDYQASLKKKLGGLVPHLILFEFLAGFSISTAANILRMGMGFTAIFGIGLVVKGEISVPVYIIFVLMGLWLYEPLSYTCENLGAVIASKVASKRIKGIMEYPEQEGSEELNPKGYDIEFKNVDFSYNKSDKDPASENKKVLSNVSFTAKQGEYTALVGASGSGKSTICRLAARFWDNDDGEILVGGQNIKDVAPEKLFDLYSIVFQDVTLFNDTIYNNILIGNKNASREEVLKAAEYAQCMPFIEKLPQGIDTILGENGHTLSGGERQRLSIARAFLKDSPIVLLDESTASIDPETETRIQAAIEKLSRGKTVLMIAHRLRSIVGCDRIIVLDEGRVVGNGSHEELMKNCEVYKKLYTLQNE